MFAMGPAFFKAAGGYATLALTGTYPAAMVGVPYSQTLAIAGGLSPYSLTGGTGVASGSLPAGLALSIVGSTLVLSGTPTTAATATFTASVGSTDSQTATSPQSVVVAAAQTVWSATNKASDVVLSGGNTIAASNSPSGGGTVLSVSSMISGKYYAEFRINKMYSASPGSGFGIHIGTSALSNYLGQDANGIGAWFQNDNIARVFQSGGTFYATSAYPGVLTAVGRLAFDASTGKIWLAYFGHSAWLASGGTPDPAAGAFPTTTLTTGSPFYLALCPRRGDASNASDRNEIELLSPASWVYGAPTGFGVWT